MKLKSLYRTEILYVSEDGAKERRSLKKEERNHGAFEMVQSSLKKKEKKCTIYKKWK